MFMKNDWLAGDETCGKNLAERTCIERVERTREPKEKTDANPIGIQYQRQPGGLASPSCNLHHACFTATTSGVRYKPVTSTYALADEPRKQHFTRIFPERNIFL